MESWVKEKREIQKWLEFTRAIATSKKLEGLDDGQKQLKLSDEGVLQRLLQDRSVSGEWAGEWLE
jgi:hypothetical protein